MRTIFILLYLTLFIHPSFSQVNDAEARAAYLLAEEYYGKADYPTALKYIESAKKSLTRTNCKILYLQIYIEKELYNQIEKKLTDEINAHSMATLGSEKYPLAGPIRNLIKKKESILEIIETFQNAPDLKSFNEEKITEILKIKLDTKRAIEENTLWLTQEEKYENNFRNYGEYNSTLNFKLGQTLEDAKVKNPLFFKKTISGTDNECNTCQLIKSEQYPSNSVYIKGNIIIGFRNELKEYNKVDLLIAHESYLSLIQKHTTDFGFFGKDNPSNTEEPARIFISYKIYRISGEPKIIKIALEQTSRSLLKYSGKLVEYIFSGL